MEGWCKCLHLTRHKNNAPYECAIVPPRFLTGVQGEAGPHLQQLANPIRVFDVRITAFLIPVDEALNLSISCCHASFVRDRQFFGKIL